MSEALRPTAHAGRRSVATRRTVLALFILVVVAGIFLVPYYWMLVSSVKGTSDIFSDLTPFSWRALVAASPTLDGYVRLFTDEGVGLALINSVLIGAIQVGGALVVCTLAAYALTRMRFPGQRLVFALILVTFMVPVEALLVPLYTVVSGLGLQDTLLAVAAPWVASVFGLFLLRQSFEEIPRELDEAARLDGAGHLRILLQVILPNLKAPLASMCLILFLFSWNSFLWPLVINQSPSAMPIQVAIAQSVSPTTPPDWSLTFAGAVVATLPLVVLFLFLQRYFVRGFASSGLK
jgi:ABC-type glycerol-3-phosphate transport system permease component